MLELKNIVKQYNAGDGTVDALKGVSLNFRKSEFVSILGPSGCGKTTMLNIIGGLDQYTSGDLVINGRSTKGFKDRDWDTYRNHSVGFVFQSYNLIPHQSVLQNVEIALSLSGVSKRERKKRAKEALEKVGLGDQLNKRPGEMSGGQMQRVAIARAIVNNPDIILADEPTGALDSQTSLQVMDILKEIAKDRLVVMVTHNPELADTYSTRIVRMLDGEIVNDSAPLTSVELEEAKASLEKQQGIPKYVSQEQKIALQRERDKKQVKPSMSFATAFGLSLKNLFTKKGRTTLTAFAGSIGIIGIALILAVSQGMTLYINTVQEDTLSSYPLTLEAQHMDLGSFMQSFMESAKSKHEHDMDAVYQKPVVYEMVNALSNIEIQQNDLAAFKEYIERQTEDTALNSAISGVQYSYNMDLLVYTKSVDGEIILSDTEALMRDMLIKYFGQNMQSSPMMGNSSMMSMLSMPGASLELWQQMLPAEDGGLINPIIEKQYQMVKGNWPTKYNEIVLVLDENNEIDDMTLFALGLKSRSEMDAIVDAAFNQQKLEVEVQKWSYEQLLNMEFRTVLNSDCYVAETDENGVATGKYVDVRDNPFRLESLYNNALTLKITGIIRPKEDAVAGMLTGTIGYTKALTDYVIDKNIAAESVKAQKDSPTRDIFTLLPFKENTQSLTMEQKKLALTAYLQGLTVAEKAAKFVEIECIISDAELAAGVNGMLAMPQAQQDAMVSQTLKAAGMSDDEIAAMLEVVKDDEQAKATLYQQVFGSIVKAQHEATQRARYKGMEAATLAGMLDEALGGYTLNEYNVYYDQVMEFSDSSYEQNMALLGNVNVKEPQAIHLYASTFADKDVIEQEIALYNESVDEVQRINYTDYVGLMMSSVTTIIDAITYVLISFVAVSLIVSSIMIGVITLISVQERTKEIGILRAIGASKRNVANMFTAETVIIGFTAGALGVGITYLLCIPINIILQALTGIKGLGAVLPVPAALILVGISILLTLFSGVIPSRSAAKKDPVVALRSE